ncbi:MAG TPA: hypothetical protein VEA16_21940 [Vicinamibacterales bacterium]|nr:hypothetical protein [Vicinamibacterales bacterium]
MAQFDPSLRRETWLFQELFAENGRKVYRRLGFNLVQYDGDPEKYIEPRPPSDVLELIDEPDIIDARTQGVGVVADFEFYTARPYPVHNFGDSDSLDVDGAPADDDQ